MDTAETSAHTELSTTVLEEMGNMPVSGASATGIESEEKSKTQEEEMEVESEKTFDSQKKGKHK